jgi:hypothetical protein
MKKIVKNEVFDEERALYGSDGIEVDTCRFDGPADGESALKESRNIEVRNSFFNLRYPFWHDDTLKISGSEMAENCTIIGTQPLCYCKNLKLINCRMIDTDLAFEKSEVEATIVSDIESVKNPKCGTIKACDVKVIIMDDASAAGKVVITGKRQCA